MPRDTQVHGLAEAAMRLFDGGLVDPKSEEIAKEYYGNVSIGRGEVEIVRRKLPQVRRILEQEFDRDLYLVNDSYYRRPGRSRDLGKEKWGGGRQLPRTHTDAQRCVPIGVRAEGIRLVTSQDDLIWLATCAQEGRAGSGITKKVRTDLLKMNERGLASESSVLAALQGLNERALPDEPQRLGKLTALSSSNPEEAE